MTQRISANGIDMAYRFDGAEDGPVVMMSHSLMSDHTMWAEQVGPLGAEFRLLRYDTRGHGETPPPPPPYTMVALAEDAVALMDALGLERVHFVGLSLGGMIGQHIGTHHGDRLLSLALCDTSSHIPPHSLWEERIAKARTVGIPSLMDTTLERWFHDAFRQRAPDPIARIRAAMGRTSVDGYVGCCRAIQAMNQTDTLSRIAVPTMVIVGRDDEGTPVAASETIHQKVAGSRLVVLDDARHLANVEQPAAFNRALLDFLESQG